VYTPYDWDSTPGIVLGDMICDRVVSPADIDPFVIATQRAATANAAASVSTRRPSATLNPRLILPRIRNRRW
jgi:hypothetical protein